ncbi:ligase-associated DNA damage response endonuclease PdeM [Methylocella sp.]|uniref:ligase-associated DNA damage response endonuclease PdeM n=1 Tax=Methylocella sp. TaxID=1978226 RepID=UPI003782EC30
MKAHEAARGTTEGESELVLLDESFVADASGALFWPREHLLVVADLHFEKGSSFAARGVFLPPYDTRATLFALARLIARRQPRVVVALGDSFHDPRAMERIAPDDRDMLRALQRGRDWIWIAGNHDPAPPGGLPGAAAAELRLGAVAFRHEPAPGAVSGEIAGHLHPSARLVGRGGSARGRSFVTDGRRCVLPAFGAFAGGLNVRDPAFGALFGATESGQALDHVAVHVIGRAGVYRVPHRLCVAG